MRVDKKLSSETIARVKNIIKKLKDDGKESQLKTKTGNICIQPVSRELEAEAISGCAKELRAIITEVLEEN